MPTKCCWVIHGNLTSERKASPFPIIIHQSLNPAARALKRQALSYMHWSTRQAQNASTRRRGNHMLDHSRFQRDIDWRHRRLSLSTTHKSHWRTIGSASALPIIKSHLVNLKKKKAIIMLRALMLCFLRSFSGKKVECFLDHIETHSTNWKKDFVELYSTYRDPQPWRFNSPPEDSL